MSALPASALLDRPRPPARHLHPSRIVQRLASSTALWEGVVEFDPQTRWYTRIALERDWEAWLLSWLPGQATEWHDHGGSAGAFTVLRGALTERVAVGRELAITPGSRVLSAGELRSFGDRHLHRVDNEGTEPAISLHVYAPGLHEMNDYAEVAPGRLELVSSRRAGVSW